MRKRLNDWLYNKLPRYSKERLEEEYDKAYAKAIHDLFISVTHIAKGPINIYGGGFNNNKVTTLNPFPEGSCTVAVYPSVVEHQEEEAENEHCTRTATQ